VGVRPSCSKANPPKAVRGDQREGPRGSSCQGGLWRTLSVPESGLYAHCSRALLPRTLWHAWLVEAIRLRYVHAELRGVYGYRRVYAERTPGRGSAVGHAQPTVHASASGIHLVASAERGRRGLAP
jgi:hypothetical protein